MFKFRTNAQHSLGKKVKEASVFPIRSFIHSFVHSFTCSFITTIDLLNTNSISSFPGSVGVTNANKPDLFSWHCYYAKCSGFSWPLLSQNGGVMWLGWGFCVGCWRVLQMAPMQSEGWFLKLVMYFWGCYFWCHFLRITAIIYIFLTLVIWRWEALWT